MTVADVATSDFPLQGCDAVIHSASAMPGNASPPEILDVGAFLVGCSIEQTVIGGRRGDPEYRSPGRKSRN